MYDSSARSVRELIQSYWPFLTLVLFSLAGRGGRDTEATSEPEGSTGNHRGEHRRYTLSLAMTCTQARPQKTAQTQPDTYLFTKPLHIWDRIFTLFKTLSVPSTVIGIPEFKKGKIHPVPLHWQIILFNIPCFFSSCPGTSSTLLHVYSWGCLLAFFLHVYITKFFWLPVQCLSAIPHL